MYLIVLVNHFCSSFLFPLTTQFVLPRGVIDLSEASGVAFDRHYFLGGSIHQTYSSYSGAVRLAKRWLSSQMLLQDYFREEAVELVVAHLYLCAAPYLPPGWERVTRGGEIVGAFARRLHHSNGRRQRLWQDWGSFKLNSCDFLLYIYFFNYSVELVNVKVAL